MNTFVQQISIFKEADQKVLGPLSEASRTISFKKGQLVLDEHDPKIDVFLILKGKVKVIHDSPDGRQVRMFEFGAGDYFNELSVFIGPDRGVSFWAITDCEVMQINGNKFKKIVTETPTIAEKLFDEWAHLIRDQVQRIKNYRGFSAEQRVAWYLLKTSHRGQKDIMLPTQEDLSSMLDMTRETLAKIVSDFYDQGILEKDNKTVKLIKVDELADLICA